MSVTKLRTPKERDLDALIAHLSRDKPDTGILITRYGDTWSWKFYGDATVMEMIGAMETAQQDILDQHRAHDEIPA